MTLSGCLPPSRREGTTGSANEIEGLDELRAISVGDEMCHADFGEACLQRAGLEGPGILTALPHINDLDPAVGHFAGGMDDQTGRPGDPD